MRSLLELYPENFPIAGSGQHAGPCPREGGEDRLWLRQDSDGREHWHCRKDCDDCPRGGDAASYLMRFYDMSFPEAADALGMPHSAKFNTGRSAMHSMPQKMRQEPRRRTETPPPDTWLAMAEKIVLWASGQLEKSSEAQEYLRGRGLTMETARTYRIGWNPSDVWRPVELFGIEPKRPGEKLKIGRGLIIPVMRHGTIRGIISRNPAAQDPKQRYSFLRRPSGVTDGQLAYTWPKKPIVVVEGQLDALAVLQVAGDLVGVVALGGGTKSPTPEVQEALLGAPLVFLALDRDEAGTDGTRKLLKALAVNPSTITAKDCRTWGEEKDPGEVLKTRGGAARLRAWVTYCLDAYGAHGAPAKPSEAAVVAEDRPATFCPAETASEPACTMSGLVDAGYLDGNVEPPASCIRCGSFAKGYALFCRAANRFFIGHELALCPGDYRPEKKG